MMSKQKLLAARELIKEKHYDEARAILKTIDDPKAREWLAKLDEIAPEKKEGALKMFFGPRRGRRRLYVSIALILALIVLVGSLALLSYMAQRGAQNTSDMIATVQAINRSRNP